MERKYELLFVNRSKHGHLTEDNFYDLSIREKVVDSEIPNNKTDEEILEDIISKHSQDWTEELSTVHKVQVKSMLSDLEHAPTIEEGDCVKIGDNVWFLTTNGFKTAP